MLGNPEICIPVSALVKVWKPRPWANSCKSTATKSTLTPWFPSNPRYQPIPSKHPGFPKSILNRAIISAVPPFRSVPESLLARAAPYQVPPNAAPGKSLSIDMAPDEARTAEVGSQGRSELSTQLALIVIEGPLFKVAPQTFAANWKALSRCCPNVPPPFPPIAATGVGSLKPTPGPSPLWIMIVTEPKAVEHEMRPTAKVSNRAGNLPM